MKNLGYDNSTGAGKLLPRKYSKLNGYKCSNR